MEAVEGGVSWLQAHHTLRSEQEIKQKPDNILMLLLGLLIPLTRDLKASHSISETFLTGML